MEKLQKKDPESYKALKRKIRQIVDSDPDSYKPLRYGMKNLKRVHIRSSFVLIFNYDKKNETVEFLDYNHHDKIYLKFR